MGWEHALQKAHFMWNDGGYTSRKKYCVVPLFTTVNDKVRNKNNSASAIDC